jgi:hypothetical protein
MIFAYVMAEADRETGPRFGDEISTNQGWGNVCRWCQDELDAGRFEPLRQLTDHGLADAARLLGSSIDEALGLNPPPDVSDTLHNLRAVCEQAGADDFLYVTDGLAPGDDDEEIEESGDA